MATNPPLDWSDLAPDVLSLVYKRLSFPDYTRAKTVCSSWYYVSRSSTPRKNHIPWLIFKQDMNWLLFNPEEGKFYRTQINQLGFANCRILATSGNWILVIDDKAYLYIINPFTLEMIDLPPLKTHHTSEYKKLASYSFHFDYGFLQKHSMQVDYAILWVDERSKDYLVVWTSTGNDLVAFCRKGYEEWFKTPGCEYRREDVDDACEDLAYNYKDEKLYILSYYGRITIWNFSQEFPRIYPNNPLYYHNNLPLKATRLKLTTSGDVLMVRRVCQYDETIRFKVYKMNSTNGDWEEVDSLEEEEALVWDLSVTLPTKGVSGIKKDSIYYCDYYQGRRPSFRKAITYEIPTQRIEQCSHLPGGVRDARWFLPCFGVGEE